MSFAEIGNAGRREGFGHMELKVQTSGKQLTVWTLCSALWSELEMQTGAWLV